MSNELEGGYRSKEEEDAAKQFNQEQGDLQEEQTPIRRQGSEIVYEETGEVETLPSYNDLVTSPENFQVQFKELIAANGHQARVIVHPFCGLNIRPGRPRDLNKEQVKYLNSSLKLLNAIVKSGYPCILFESVNSMEEFTKICQERGVMVDLEAGNICTIPTQFHSPTPFLDGDQVEDEYRLGSPQELLNMTKKLHDDYGMQKAIAGGEIFKYGADWRENSDPEADYTGYTEEPFVANTGPDKGTEQEIEGCVAMVVDALRSSGVEVKMSNIASDV